MRQFAGLLLVGLGSAGSVSAAEPVGQYYFANYVVPEYRDVGTYTIPKFDPILQFRVYSEQPIVLEEDLRSASGDLLLAKGSEMAVARASAPTACAVSKSPAPPKNKNRFICVIDQNRDGKFDRWYVGPDPTIPNAVSAPYPKADKIFVASPASFRKIPVEESTPVLRSAIMVSLGLTKRMVIICQTKKDEYNVGKCLQLGRNKIDALPFETGLYYSKYEILSIDDKETTFRVVVPLEKMLVNADRD